MGMILPRLFSALHALSIINALKCFGGLVSLLPSSLRNAVVLPGGMAAGGRQWES